MRACMLALLLIGCTQPSTDRCVQVKAELDACVGTKLPDMDCTTLSDTDIERVHDLTTGLSCSLLAGALPLDGDYLSAVCRLADVGCVAAVTPAPTQQPARYPILLVNGIDTSSLFRYSDRIVDMMQNQGGQPVFLATLPAYQPPRTRAPLLWKRMQDVMKQTGADKVNLVCHTLGGLDCRYVGSPAGLATDLGDAAPLSAIASITTVSTAHHGTRVADVLVGLVPSGNQAQLVTDLAAWIGDWFGPSSLTQDPQLLAALNALTVTEASSFNAEIVDNAAIYYQSFGGVSRPRGEASLDHNAKVAALCAGGATTIFGKQDLSRIDYMALPLQPLTAEVGEPGGAVVPNDGLVAVESAKWGHFRGCLPADHMEQLGQHGLPDANVRNGFDIARFYTNVAADLAAQGF